MIDCQRPKMIFQTRIDLLTSDERHNIIYRLTDYRVYRQRYSVSQCVYPRTRVSPLIIILYSYIPLSGSCV